MCSAKFIGLNMRGNGGANIAYCIWMLCCDGSHLASHEGID